MRTYKLAELEKCVIETLEELEERKTAQEQNVKDAAPLLKEYSRGMMQAFIESIRILKNALPDYW